MKKNVLVYLVPIVLVIGTAFGIGIVIGDTEDSQVTVDVDYVAPTIEITDYPDFVGWEDNVEVEALVTTPNHENAVEDVEFEFEYVGGKEAGDAYRGPEKDEDPDIIDDWDKGEATYEGTFELPDGENMWQAEEWKITATVYGTEDGCEDFDEVDVFVDEYLDIVSVDDGEAVGEPGDELYGDDFNVPGEDYQPQITITSNNNWELEFGDYTLVHEEDDTETIPGTGDYDEDSGNAVWEKSININYEVDIPWGAMHGTYTTEDDQATHTLTGICLNLVGDWYDLDAIRDDPESDFILVDDLDEDSAGYDELVDPDAEPYEGSWTPIEIFYGTFEGNGNTISDLIAHEGIEGPWCHGDSYGLFATLTYSAEVNNLELENVEVDTTGDYDYAPHVGSLAAINYGTISDVSVTDGIVADGTNPRVGGLVALNRGTIENSWTGEDLQVGMGDEMTHLSLNEEEYENLTIGGLVARNDGDPREDYVGLISNSYSEAEVLGGSENAIGGLVGRNWGGTIENSYATGDVSGNNWVGGLVGWNQWAGVVENSYSTGEVSGDDNVGGLVGTNSNEVINSYWDTETSGQTESAGGTGLETDDMTGEDAPDNMDGFDFENVWATTDNYPVLQWQE